MGDGEHGGVHCVRVDAHRDVLVGVHDGQVQVFLRGRPGHRDHVASRVHDDDVLLRHDPVVERRRRDGDVAVLHPRRDVPRGPLDQTLLQQLLGGGDDLLWCVLCEGGHGLGAPHRSGATLVVRWSPRSYSLAAMPDTAVRERAAGYCSPMGLLDGRSAVVTGAGGASGGRSHSVSPRRGPRSSSTTSGGRSTAPAPPRTRRPRRAGSSRTAGGKAVPNGDSVADFDGAGRIIAQARRHLRVASTSW